MSRGEARDHRTREIPPHPTPVSTRATLRAEKSLTTGENESERISRSGADGDRPRAY